MIDRNLIRKEITEIDNFNPTKAQKLAIQARNHELASNLGVTFDQYLASVVPNYRAKLSALLN